MAEQTLVAAGMVVTALTSGWFFSLLFERLESHHRDIWEFYGKPRLTTFAKLNPLKMVRLLFLDLLGRAHDRKLTAYAIGARLSVILGLVFLYWSKHVSA